MNIMETSRALQNGKRGKMFHFQKVEVFPGTNSKVAISTNLI
jgi:hypothetical protein